MGAGGQQGQRAESNTGDEVPGRGSNNNEKMGSGELPSSGTSYL